MSIDHKATKVHGFSDEYFIEHGNDYGHFDVNSAREIVSTLKNMKQVFAHNLPFDLYHI